MLRIPVTWLIVGLFFVGVCALETLDVDTRRRLVDVFGDPVDLLDVDVDTDPANGTDCICLPYSRCKVSNDSFYGTEASLSRHMSCVNIFDWCCEPNRVRMNRPLRVGCGWSGGDIASKGDYTSRAGDISKVGDANDTAAFGEFPWLVAILNISAGDTWSEHEYIGGGSIIHLSVVLTAAHKVDGVDHKQLKCRAGEWDSRSVAEPLSHQDRKILKVTRHEGYARHHVANSIALLFLKTPFVSSPHIGPGCVARAPPPGACVGTGWGRRRHGARETYSKVLKKVKVPIVNDATCTAVLRETYLGRSFSLHASQLCAGARDADTCAGDGGAPLLCPTGISGHRYRYAIFGMAAWGVGCGDRPAVYVKVSKFHGWLADVLEANGLDSASYQYEDDDFISGHRYRYAIFGMAAWGVGCGDRPAVYVKVSKFHGWLADVLEANGLDSASYQYEDDDFVIR